MGWTWLCRFALPMLVNGDDHSPQWGGPEEHRLMLTASLVLSGVFIERLLSTWRPPTLLHSHSNRKSWITVTVIAILEVQADRAVCLRPFRLALHPVFSERGPCSLRREPRL